ncbi:metalloregulator ArsR/SmtB family transcription factor [Candidatus Roizmanbacteria bacterium]|nr:metalloregulator ArsR/SmtB family transcription factor [Candidatus Roizmanbacteria bacterium]
MYSEVFTLHSKLLKALSNPKRLEILHLLRNSELTVSSIQKMLYLPQGNLSQHLMVLREAHVVATRRKGREIYYKIAHTNFIKASDLIRELLIKQHKDNPQMKELTRNMTDLVPLTQDPVCKMRISPKTASFVTKLNGNPFYFCASGCYKKFKENKEKYLKTAQI